MENNIQKEDLLALVKSKIYTIRGQKVMLDFDLAAMYGVETRAMNQAVKRNIERFPDDFMFQLTKGEFMILKSQIATSNSNDIQDNSTKATLCFHRKRCGYAKQCPQIASCYTGKYWYNARFY